jgi:uncharacterized membrane protein YfcA
MTVEKMVATPILLFAIETVIVAIASTLQAATGMGMALLAAPLLALVDPTLVPGPTLAAVMALSTIVAWRERAAIDRHVLVTALAGLLIGCMAGAVLLALLVGLKLGRVFAVIILGGVLLSVSGMRVRASRFALLIGGLGSGILGTMAGVHGPPIALVLQHEPPDRLRATLCAFFAVGCLVSIFALAVTGVFGIAQIKLGIRLLPGVAIGVIFASVIGRRIDRQRARIAVLVVSALSALALLLH